VVAEHDVTEFVSDRGALSQRVFAAGDADEHSSSLAIRHRLLAVVGVAAGLCAVRLRFRLSGGRATQVRQPSSEFAIGNGVRCGYVADRAAAVDRRGSEVRAELDAGVADNPDDPVAKGLATIKMAGVASDLVANGLGALQDLPYFPQRVIRQCGALNAGVADPDGEAVQSFSVPQRPVDRAEGARIDAVIREDCV
jgi:hypothetical protein